MTEEWISEEEALAIAELRTGLGDPWPALAAAISDGQIAVTFPAASEDDGPKIYPGGFTEIDIQYDDRFRRRILRGDLERWLKRLAPINGKAGRPSKRKSAASAYRSIYPQGHRNTGDQWEHVCRKVSARMGESVSKDTIERGLKEPE